MTASGALRLVAAALALAGAGLRLWDFGAGGFWNDEAWVALASRVEGLEQFLLAVSVTPIGWAALLRPLALVPGPPEIVLRLLPLAFGLATIGLAWRLGERLAGHALGGVFATALVAFDPASIAWSRELKPYSAEAALALGTYLAADAVGRRSRAADVVRLAVVLAAGSLVSHAQLLLAPPLLAALGTQAWRRGDRRTVGRLVLAAGVVGAWDLGWFLLAVRPRLSSPALREFWRGQYPPLDDGAAFLRFVQRSYARLLQPALGSHAVWLTLAGTGALAATRRGGWAALATILLVLELIGLSVAGRFPLGAERTQLFVVTILLVTTGAAAGHWVARLWRRPSEPLALAVVVGLVRVVVPGRASPRSESMVVEDLGPLLQVVARERRPGDRVLVYERSAFIWGYYRAKPPRLRPSAAIANGFVVEIDDPDVILVRPGRGAAAVARAAAGGGRVWFVGSRFKPNDQRDVRAALAEHGRIVRDERRVGAVLLLAEPRRPEREPTAPGTPAPGRPLGGTVRPRP